MEVTITNENFESLKNGSLPLVVDFWDVEECEELAVEFGIRNIPTILFFKNGQIVDKMVGAQSKAKLEEKFQALL